MAELRWENCKVPASSRTGRTAAVNAPRAPDYDVEDDDDDDDNDDDVTSTGI